MTKKEKLEMQLITDFIELSMNRGLMFSIHATNSCFLLNNSQEIIEYVADPDNICAKKQGVSKSQYQSWRDHVRGITPHPMCRGRNKNGRKCGNRVYCRAENPRSFDSSGTYCDRHLLTKGENQ